MRTGLRSSPLFLSFSVDTRLIVAFLLIAAALTPWIENLDTLVAYQFFDADTGEWLVPRGRPMIWYFLYRAPKVLLVVIACCLVLAMACSYRIPDMSRFRKPILLSLLAMGLIPGLVAWLKHLTGIYCPSQTTMFGGIFLQLGVFDIYPVEMLRPKLGQCWPAAHASGGFGLMGIMVFAKKSDWRGRLYLTLPGFILGWIMALFQMARGSHFLSHAFASLGIALLVIWLLEWAASSQKQTPAVIL